MRMSAKKQLTITRQLLYFFADIKNDRVLGLWILGPCLSLRTDPQVLGLGLELQVLGLGLDTQVLGLGLATQVLGLETQVAW